MTQEQWPEAPEKCTGVVVSWPALLWALWATAAVPVSLLALKHLLATNIQTLWGSWLCGLTPTMHQSPCYPHCPCRGFPGWQRGRYSGTAAVWAQLLARPQLALSGGTCRPQKGSWRWGFIRGWGTNLGLGRSASISSLLSAFVLPSPPPSCKMGVTALWCHFWAKLSIRSSDLEGSKVWRAPSEPFWDPCLCMVTQLFMLYWTFFWFQKLQFLSFQIKAVLAGPWVLKLFKKDFCKE